MFTFWVINEMLDSENSATLRLLSFGSPLFGELEMLSSDSRRRLKVVEDDGET